MTAPKPLVLGFLLILGFFPMTASAAGVEKWYPVCHCRADSPNELNPFFGGYLGTQLYDYQTDCMASEAAACKLYCSGPDFNQSSRTNVRFAVACFNLSGFRKTSLTEYPIPPDSFQPIALSQMAIAFAAAVADHTLTSAGRSLSPRCVSAKPLTLEEWERSLKESAASVIENGPKVGLFGGIVLWLMTLEYRLVLPAMSPPVLKQLNLPVRPSESYNFECDSKDQIGGGMACRGDAGEIDVFPQGDRFWICPKS